MDAVLLTELRPAHAGHAIRLADLVVTALIDEVTLSPKPGLVDVRGRGAHHDLDWALMCRSAHALRPTFASMAEAGATLTEPLALRERIGLLGRDGEATMLAATGGINTHRGAIFVLGLLCAAAAAAQAHGGTVHAAAVRDALQCHWGTALAARSERPSTLPGGLAARRLGLRSASQEAALGFAALFETALPAWAQARRLGLPLRRLQVFFSILAVLDDANLAHRGGLAGLHFARTQARAWLDRGGAARADARDAAWAIHRDFVARRLSPGGCADMLAATCFLHRLGSMG